MARITPVPEITYLIADELDETATDLAFDYLFDLLLGSNSDEGGSLPQG